MLRNPNKRQQALNKALLAVEKKEQRLAAKAQKTSPAGWKQQLEEKIPDRVFTGLESAFGKGFSLVFAQGRIVIEKGYSKEKLRSDFAIRDYAFQVKGSRRELRRVQKGAKQGDMLNLTLTTAEGLGLGILGIGMPDIVLFLGTLLKGIYETALNYGCDYESRQEQLLILKMMETALSYGEDWLRRNEEVDEMLELETLGVTEETLNTQLQSTASAFAMDMLLLKFIQGIPIVGILGGIANPIYYSKIMNYVELKYRKRYLRENMA